ncbi:ABC transporter ATP-binding protein [Nocardioides sp.]|nr:ABC transporter ATP-binding protein [Nocardioides sp.]
MPHLATHGLSCVIGGRTILSGVDLEVRRGEVLGLIGANGTGKSTLLRVLAGVRRPAAGSVRLAGESLTAMRPRLRARHLAFVAQEETGPTDLLVGEMVGLGRVPHARAWGGFEERSRGAIRAALDQVDLGYAINQPLDRLSGGERRRALIARGLAQEAPLLLLDEPTNHLDIGHQLALMRRIRALSRTVVVALHDLDLAATFCDRVAVLHDGALLACGEPDEVLTPSILHDAFGVLATRVTHPITGRTHLLFSRDEREPHP